MRVLKLTPRNIAHLQQKRFTFFIARVAFSKAARLMLVFHKKTSKYFFLAHSITIGVMFIARGLERRRANLRLNGV